MRIGLKFFFLLVTLACIGFGGWYQYKMYHWHRKIPLVPIHAEASDYLSSEITVVFDQVAVDEAIEKAKQVNLLLGDDGEKTLSKLQVAEALQSEPEEPVKKLQKSQTLLRQYARRVLKNHDRDGIEWLFNEYRGASDGSKRLIRDAIFNELQLTPQTWLPDIGLIEQLIRDELSFNQRRNVLNAVRFAERAGTTGLVDDLNQLAEARRDQLKVNLDLFGEEPVGELVRVSCNLDPSARNLKLVKRMVGEYWQRDPEIEEVTPAEQYDTLAKSLLALSHSSDPETATGAEKYIERLNLGAKVARLANMQSDEAALKTKLRDFYLEYLRPDEPDRFEVTFELAHVSCRNFRFRTTVDQSASIYVREMIKIEGLGIVERPVRDTRRAETLSRPLMIKCNGFEPLWYINGEKDCEIVTADRLYQFSQPQISLAYYDILNQIFERQRSRKRVAVFLYRALNISEAIYCDAETFQALKNDVGCEFTTETNDLFQKLSQ